MSKLARIIVEIIEEELKEKVDVEDLHIDLDIEDGSVWRKTSGEIRGWLGPVTVEYSVSRRGEE